MLLGGNSGQKRKAVVMQNPDYRKSIFILEENMIQAVTKLILSHIRNNR